MKNENYQRRLPVNGDYITQKKLCEISNISKTQMTASVKLLKNMVKNTNIDLGFP